MIHRKFVSMKYMIFIVTIITICCMSIKGTLSLDSSLSNMCVNTFTFTQVIEPDNEQGTTSNDETNTNSSNVNTNTRTNDDTTINLILLGMLVSIGGLALCWSKENKIVNEEDEK